MSLVLDSVMLAMAGLIVYAWMIYPLCLRAVAARRGRVAGTSAAGLADGASVGVVLSAHNEATHIGDRIRNLLEEVPPGHAYEIHVGVDACSDDTADVAQRAAAGHAQVHVHAFPQRRGKVAVIKDLVARCQADILILTDANTFFSAGAVQKLLAALRDPAVGGACGRLALVETLPAGGLAGAETDAATDEGFYWRWETALKTRESALDSCLGANGAIVALRRALFWHDMPDNTMVDDFVLGMKVREQGARVVYVPEAVAVEELPHVRHEWVRRVRIGAGDFQALVFCARCLLPRYGWFAWCFWSHKVLRWITPHMALVLALASALALAAGAPCTRGLGALCLLGLGGVTALALFGAAVRDCTARWARLPRLCLHFVSMQAALFVGFLRFASGDLTGHWKRTPRKE